MCVQAGIAGALDCCRLGATQQKEHEKHTTGGLNAPMEHWHFEQEKGAGQVVLMAISRTVGCTFPSIDSRRWCHMYDVLELHSWMACHVMSLMLAI